MRQVECGMNKGIGQQEKIALLVVKARDSMHREYEAINIQYVEIYHLPHCYILFSHDPIKHFLYLNWHLVIS